MNYDRVPDYHKCIGNKSKQAYYSMFSLYNGIYVESKTCEFIND